MTANVPFMITNAMRGHLRAAGYPDHEIDNMTPAQAWNLPVWLEAQGGRFCKVTAWNDPGDSPGKKPIGNDWQKKPLTWAQVKPHVTNGGNVGLICGQYSGGLILLDIDDDLPGFLSSFPQFEDYPRIERGHPNKGKFIIRLTDEYTGQKKFKKSPQDKHPYLEVLATGNQGVIPPSIHPERGHYEFINPGADIPTMTPQALATIAAGWQDLQAPAPVDWPPAPDRSTNDNGHGPDLRDAVKAAWPPYKVFEYFGLTSNGTKKEGEFTRILGNGGLFVNNNGVTWALTGSGKGWGGDCFDAWHFCETNGQAGKLPPADFRPTLLKMATAAGIPIPTAGKRPAAKQAHSQPPEPEFLDDVATGAQPGGQDKKAPTPDDSQLAARWLAANTLTAYGMGDFRRYDGGIWAAVEIDPIRKELKAIIDAARFEGVRPTNGRLVSVMELARIEIAITSNQWDANHDYLICKNGALHIPTRQLQPHNPELYATSGLDFNYDPTAQAPTFKAVLQKCIPAAADFVQEFAGYALTTDTSHELALWFYGPPGSGKSTILGGFQAMLGARAGLLGLADIERSRFALNSLPGKTLVVSTEQPETFMAATHILNAIISGEPITIEQKFKDAITIIPRAKLAWAMNDLPRVNGANNGIMRRVKVVKFPALAAAERDPEVKERIKHEGAGVLNWALEGLARLQKRGRFVVPQCVEDATQEFKETNDVPALFLDDSGVLLGDNFKTGSQQLYNAYRTWCIENGHKPQSSTSIANEWERLGFEGYKANGRKYWRGIGLPLNTNLPDD